jgi:subtilisin family serine protease
MIPVTRLFLLVSLVLGLLGAAPAGAAERVAGGESAWARYKPTGRILVRFKPGASAAGTTRALAAAEARPVDAVPGLRVRVLFPSADGPEAALARLRRDPNVEYAEPERVIRVAAIPNDDYYRSQWGLAKVSAPSGWNISTGSTTVKLAVVDTGVDYNHPDLKYRYAGGYDFYNGDANPMDDNGHGTHVAGIAAASGNNGIGVAGIGWRTKILAVKVLDRYGGGSDATVSKGIVWAADHGAAVINLSLGSPASSRTITEAVEYAQRKGALVVAAAGNYRYDPYTGLYWNPTTWPAALPGVVGVAATTESDADARFSQYGSYVDIAAPGVGILSTLPGNRYGSMDGTSMATPFVAGAAAVVKARFPAYSADQVWTRIRTTARDLGTAGYDQRTGYGRLNLYGALAVPGTVSGAVRDERSGAPLAGAWVGLTGTSRSVRTDANGHYTFPLVPYGARTLLFRRTGYQSASRTVTMPAGGRVVQSPALKRLATLTGYTRDSSGRPIAGATVRFSGLTRTALTNSLGYYSVANFPLGTRTATAGKAGYSSRSRTATFATGATVRLDFALPRE